MTRLLAFPAGRRGKWVVLIAWFVLLAVASPFAGKLYKDVNNDRLGYLPKSAESTSVLKEQAHFPQGRVDAAVIVYQRDSGLTAADRHRASADESYLMTKYAPKEPVASPAVSTDGKALTYQVPLVAPANKQEGAYILDSVSDIRTHLGTPNGGLLVKVTGPAGRDADQFLVFRHLQFTFVLIPIFVVALLLLLIYRSPFLFLVPLASVALASQLGSALLDNVIRHTNLVINEESAGVLSILIYGAGTDYALLLIARYREELGRHEDRHEAMKVALQRSAGAITASGCTVALGLLCLFAADLNATRALAPAGALAVASALLAMLTLLPALLVICGRWIFWPRSPQLGEARATGRLWQRVATVVSTRARLVWMVTAVLLAVGAIGLTAFNIPQRTQYTKPVDSATGQNLVSAHFPVGDSNPAVLIANADKAAQVRAATLAAGATGISAVGTAGTRVQYNVNLNAVPGTAAERSAVQALRDRVHAVRGADAMVGGAAATALDQRNTDVRDTWLTIPLVLLVILLILVLVLRALTLSILLILTVVLSYAATLGISTAVFEYVFHWKGQDPQLPLIAFVFLVALGVDYNIFLMSRVREESARLGTRDGVVTGLVATGGVITSAGLVLAATFSVLLTLPVVSFGEQGFVIGLGVLIDTFVVRSLLVPSLIHDIGDRVWWPSGLSRRAAHHQRGRRLATERSR